MRKLRFSVHLVVCFLFAVPFGAMAQKPAYTANNVVSPYTADFAYGSNQGYYGGYNNGAPSDKLLADLMAKASIHTTRPALYDRFLEQYGLNIRLPEFQYYTGTLGMKEITLFVSGPSDAHRDTTTILCNGVKKRSQMFKNLYLPIWDDSTNGKTPINDQNFYAAYIYKLVKTYGPYVKFYEVWNEPDFTTGGNPYKTSGTAGNWYDNGPSPCDLDNMYASITSYIRTLRITYEVVKSLDPNAYVTTGGIGYESFLDVMMRYTDNPDGGKVTSAYPLKGGAYFDVLSFHYYPQYTLNSWDNSIGGFRYFRHSDKAAQVVFNFKDKLNNLLKKHGYDGATFPAKHFILTEVNIPRHTYAGKDWIGSPEAQRNFIIKTFVMSQKQNVLQMYTYNLGDIVDESASTGSSDGMDNMGMYYNLNKATPSTATLSPAGIASKSVSDFLYTYKYDAAKTTALALPATVEGAAFTKGSETRYVFWAKTSTDMSEVASAAYTFPSSMGVQTITTRPWNNGTTPSSTTIAGNVLNLTGSPVFVTLNATAVAPSIAVTVANQTITLPTNTVALPCTVSNATATSYVWTQTQGPGIATLANANTATLTASNLLTGTYVFSITVKDATGKIATAQAQVVVNAAPVMTVTAGNAQTITLPTNSVQITSTVSNGTPTSYAWTQKQGPSTATLSNASTKTLTASNLVAGTYVFAISVKDAAGKTASSQVQITVNAAPVTTSLVTISFPDVTNMNLWKDKSTNTFYRSTIRIQAASTNPDAITRVDFTLNSTTNTDSWPDISTTTPAVYSFNYTYYALAPGTYTVKVVVTDKKNVQTASNVTFTIVDAVQTSTTTLPYKITFPQVAGMNQWKDQSTGTFYQSTIRVQAETTTPDAIQSVTFTMNGNSVTDDWADITTILPSTYYYHNTYYALPAGTYTVEVVVTDKKGLKTTSKVNFTMSGIQAREDGVITGLEAEESLYPQSGPYFLYNVQGVLLAQGNGPFNPDKLNIASGIYIIKTPEKTVRVYIQR